jgi:hypothetical protein
MANSAATFIIVLSILIGFRYLRAGALTFLFLSYALWLGARVTNFWFCSQKNEPLLYSWLSPFEKRTYKQFALYIHHSALAFFLSTTLHWIRIASIAWIVVSVWQLFYVEAIALTLFTLLSSGTISTMYPDLYFEDAARRGNRGAMEMLQALRHVQSIVSPTDQRPPP